MLKYNNLNALLLAISIHHAFNLAATGSEKHGINNFYRFFERSQCIWSNLFEYILLVGD